MLDGMPYYWLPSAANRKPSCHLACFTKFFSRRTRPMGCFLSELSIERVLDVILAQDFLDTDCLHAIIGSGQILAWCKKRQPWLPLFLCSARYLAALLRTRPSHSASQWIKRARQR